MLPCVAYDAIVRAWVRFRISRTKHTNTPTSPLVASTQGQDSEGKCGMGGGGLRGGTGGGTEGGGGDGGKDEQQPSHTLQPRLTVRRWASAHDSVRSDAHCSNDPPLPTHCALQLEGGGGFVGGSGGTIGPGGARNMRT